MEHSSDTEPLRTALADVARLAGLWSETCEAASDLGSAEVMERLGRVAPQVMAAIGDAWLLPSPSDDSKPCSRHLMKNWWKKAGESAGLKPVEGRGWHSLRRKFATELKDEPLKDLCQLGGWKNPQTVLKCYRTADEESMREALSRRRTLKKVGEI